MVTPSSSDDGLQRPDELLRVLCVAKRWEHHTASGGYDQLAHAVGAEVIRRRLRSDLLHRFKGRLWREFSHPIPYLLDYRFEDWLVERHVLSCSQLSPPDVVHVLYGDEQLDLLLLQRQRLLCPLVATFHLPPRRVRERFEVFQKHLIAGLDLAIVVARSQLPDFRKWMGDERVVYVPHGIDSSRFCPRDVPPRGGHVRLVTVGHHMRDWKALDAIIARCQTQKLEVDFDIVAQEHHLTNTANLPNVHFHSGISEEQLIQLYRQADSLLLPVLDATATNAALESLACGTPVITSKVGGMPDYVDETCGWLFGGAEVDQIVELIGEICNRPQVASSLRSGARKKALAFSWKRVAAKMRTLYEALARRRTIGTIGRDWE